MHAIAKLAADSVATMGAALSTCTVPGAPPSSRLDGNTIELGMGIHGEAGRSQMQMPSSQAAAVITDAMLDRILSSKALAGHTGKCALLINNLGSTPSLEQYIVTRHAILTLRRKGYTVSRVFVGNFMTALEMAGVSISILSLRDDRVHLLEHLDEATTAPAWVPSADLSAMEQAAEGADHTVLDDQQAAPIAGPPCGFFVPVLRAICVRIM